MNLNTEYIKKLMGWCPNASPTGPKNPLFSSQGTWTCAPDSAGNTPNFRSGWWSRLRNRILVISSCLTLFSVYWVGFQGIGSRSETFIVGLGSGFILNLLFSISSWHSLNKMKYRGKAARPVNRQVIIALLFLGLLSLLVDISWLGPGVVFTFVAGFCFSAPLYYVTLVSWEKKNKKTVVLYGNFMPESGIVDAGEE